MNGEDEMVNVLFICHGNICRSPIAHMILNNYIKVHNLEDQISVDSKACSSEEIGNSIYPNAKKCLIEHSIPIIEHYATKFEAKDYKYYDYIICMDKDNIYRMNKIKNDTDNKYYLLFDFINQNREVADPWYTRDFNKTFNDLIEGINGFINYLVNNKMIKEEINEKI